MTEYLSLWRLGIQFNNWKIRFLRTRPESDMATLSCKNKKKCEQ